MNKDLDYYLSLPYPIEVVAITDDDGGGYMAAIPLLGKNTCIGDGETEAEAIESVKAIQRDLLEHWIAAGKEIPEPTADESQPSGRFVLRISRRLHAKLANLAATEGVSLNAFVAGALERQAVADTISREVDQRLTTIEAQLNTLSTTLRPPREVIDQPFRG